MKHRQMVDAAAAGDQQVACFKHLMMVCHQGTVPRSPVPCWFSGHSLTPESSELLGWAPCPAPAQKG